MYTLGFCTVYEYKCTQNDMNCTPERRTSPLAAINVTLIISSSSLMCFRSTATTSGVLNRVVPRRFTIVVSFGVARGSGVRGV